MIQAANITQSKEEFLQLCKAIGMKPKQELKEVVWYEKIPDKAKKLNEEIVQKMFDYAKELMGHEDTDECQISMLKVLTIYYNGFVSKFDDELNIKIEKYEKVPFGEPRMLPNFCFGCYDNDSIATSFNSAIDSMGLYVDVWNYGQYVVGEMDSILTEEDYEEFNRSISTEKEVYIHSNRADEKIPVELKLVQKVWRSMCSQTGDSGGCVIGEGMRFKYGGQKYKMPPASPFQGEGSWTPHVSYITECLVALGCEGVYWDCGRLD